VRLHGPLARQAFWFSFVINFKLMNPSFFLFALFGCLWLSDGLAPASAQVPPEFSDLYPVLQTDITNFETSLDAGWDGTFWTNRPSDRHGSRNFN